VDIGSLIKYGALSMTTKAITLYTLPGCSHCETLKDWLKRNDISYEEEFFNSEAQVEFIMKNIFSDPPILELASKILTYEEIFRGEELDEEKLKGVFNETDQEKR